MASFERFGKGTRKKYDLLPFSNSFHFLPNAEVNCHLMNAFVRQNISWLEKSLNCVNVASHTFHD